MADELLITEIEGPRGTAEIFEVIIPNQEIMEIEYAVVFAGDRKGVPSLGEAHILANQLTGVDEDS